MNNEILGEYTANFNPVRSIHKMHVHSIQFDFIPVWNVSFNSFFRGIQIFFLLGNHHH